MEFKGQDNFVIVPTVGGTDISLDTHNHDHDTLTNVDSNEHIDHTTITLSAGIGLTGGGTIAANRTFDLDINGLTADGTPDTAADYVATYDASAGTHKKVLLTDLGSGGGGISYTEAFTNLGRPSSSDTWQTKTVTGAAVNSVIQIVIQNDTNSAENVGVREVGSGLSRFLPIVRDATITFMTMTDGSGQIQWYSGSTNSGVSFFWLGELA
jgi:hypothetical protein